MKTVQLVTRRQRRGAEVYAAELSKGFAAHGQSVWYVGINAPPSHPLEPEGAWLLDLDTRPGKSKLNPWLVYRLGQHCRKEQPDLVQCHGSYALKYAILSRKLMGGQWNVVYHNIGLSSDWLRWPGHRRWMQWLVHSADQTVSVSAESRADLQKTYNLSEEKTGVIHRGVPTAPVYDPQEARKHLMKLGLPSVDHDALLHVGAFTPEKNHRWLVDALPAIQAERPEVHLFLAGGGPEREAVEQQVESAGMEEYVHLLGVRDDVSKLMAGADLMVLPSLTEGLPGVVMEAGAQGLPTVANDVGGVHAAVRDGETGMLVPEGDQRAFVQAVARLLEDAGRRRKMSEAVRQHIRRHFSVERSVKDFEALFQNVIADDRG